LESVSRWKVAATHSVSEQTAAVKDSCPIHRRARTQQLKGEVVYLFAFDVANEIQTSRVSDVSEFRLVSADVRVDHTYPKDVPLYKPLAVEPTSFGATLRGSRVGVTLRIFEVGVISVVARIPVEASCLDELMSWHTQRLDDGSSLDRAARKLCSDACKSLVDVMIHSSAPSEPEAYTIFCLTQLDGISDVSVWLAEQRGSVAGLLAETHSEKLSDAQVNESLRVQRSFSRTDATVIDWDAALLVDLDGYVDDVLYVLELANLQLEEYRQMDRRLDAYLTRAYEDVQRKQLGIFGSYTQMLRKLRLFRVDVTRLSDEVSHIGKFFGDWFLARVYIGASERFYLDHWRNSIEQRLDQLDKLYNVVNNEVMNRRLLWLELLIVVFFAIDLLLLVLLRS
jgi:hypothetical protein